MLAGRSTLAHAFGRFRRRAGPHLVFDLPPDFAIDAPPILEGAAKHRLAHPAEQAARDGVDERAALRVVEDLAHKNAGLGEIIVLGPQSIGTAYHLAVRLPSFADSATLV